MSKQILVKSFEENSSESLEVLKDILYIAEVASGPIFRKMIVLHMEILNYVFGTVKDSTLKQKTVKHRLPLLTNSNFCSSSTAGYGMLLNSQF